MLRLAADENVNGDIVPATPRRTYAPWNQRSIASRRFRRGRAGTSATAAPGGKDRALVHVASSTNATPATSAAARSS